MSLGHQKSANFKTAILPEGAAIHMWKPNPNFLGAGKVIIHNTDSRAQPKENPIFPDCNGYFLKTCPGCKGTVSSKMVKKKGKIEWN